MFEKMLNRIMLGAKTPEGKFVAILLTFALAFMVWDSRMMRVAFAADGSASAQSAEVVEQDDSADNSADEAASDDAADEGVSNDAMEPADEAVADVSEESAPADEAAVEDAGDGGANNESGSAASSAVEDTSNDESGESSDASAVPESGTSDSSASSGAVDSSDESAAASGDAASAGAASAGAADKSGASSSAASDASKSAAAADADKDADEQEEEEYPEQSLYDSANGIDVSVDAPEGALPEGAELYVTSAGDYKDAIASVVSDEVVDSSGVDAYTGRVK